MEPEVKKRMGRPKGSKNKASIPHGGTTEVIKEVIIEKPIEVIKEIVVERLVEKKELSGFDLYKKLKDAGFPQGGIGAFEEDLISPEKVYIPHISEVYGQFIADPKDWDKLRDAMCRVWIDKSKK